MVPPKRLVPRNDPDAKMSNLLSSASHFREEYASGLAWISSKNMAERPGISFFPLIITSLSMMVAASRLPLKTSRIEGSLSRFTSRNDS
ncbi:MAG: hypothetical protein E7Z69_04015 [Thermoplasmata archaeon]|nr:hypothetical protein [Thermoplasmata archaeon]